jgi:hypothetical protein
MVHFRPENGFILDRKIVDFIRQSNTRWQTQSIALLMLCRPRGAHSGPLKGVTPDGEGLPDDLATWHH